MILKHRDREVLRFDWGRYGDVRNVEINPKEEQYLPIVLREKAGKDDARRFEYALDDWLGSRTAPLNRRNVRDMLQSLGFKPRDPLYRKALIEFCRGLSLNDVHWVVKDDSRERWADANLYRNEFSTAIATMVRPVAL